MKESSNENQISTEEILDQKEMIDSNSNLLRNSEEKDEVNEEIQIEQDKVKMSLVNLSVSIVRAADVLRTTDISDSDNFRLIKFQIRVRAVYLYKWVVIHKPAEIKSNFKAISEELKKKSVDFDDEIREIFRRVEEMDLEFVDQHLKNIEDAKKALKKCKEIVDEYNLNMMILDANYTFDRSQLLFTFLADSRVDFRKLAKDLANTYKTRIELRQVGVRDKAKEVGGYGCCGQVLCCSKFLTDFDSVSINMAKNQNIALNPTKINGVCGRLLCCLKYEDECYKECAKKLPKVGKKVDTEFGEGKVISAEILKQTYRVDVKDHGIVEVKVDESN